MEKSNLWILNPTNSATPSKLGDPEMPTFYIEKSYGEKKPRMVAAQKKEVK